MRTSSEDELSQVWNQSVLILLCGGSGSRIQTHTEDKTLLPLAGKPVFLHALLTWCRVSASVLSTDSVSASGSVNLTPSPSPVILVYRDEAQRSQMQKSLQSTLSDTSWIYWAQGGKSRKESVQSALNTLNSFSEDIQYVFIHDAARPLIHQESLQDLAEALLTHRAATLAREVTDTIHYAPSPEKWSILDRKKLWQMETPQAFQRSLIVQAYQYIERKQLEITDDVSALIHIQEPVHPVVSRFPNIKLTRPADIPLIEYYMNHSKLNFPEFRVGQGFDIHQFAENRKLILGGIEIPYHRGLSGHSDADCLTHALADAILGACGLPDIGHFFPNHDPAIQNIDSLLILERAVREASQKNWCIVNCDIAVMAEAPKIGPHLQSMKEVLSQRMGISPDRIGIKATTLEKIGGLGRGEGIACMATVLLREQV